jgi:hypothetical protein
VSQAGSATGGTEHGPPQGAQRENEREEVQEERDMDSRFDIQSYRGKNDEEREVNRKWFKDTYPRLFCSMPTEEELLGNGHTVEMSLKLLGVALRTESECNDFFNNIKREEMLKEKMRWFNVSCKNGIHPDKFNAKVANEKMRLENQHRCAALRKAVDALKEWGEVALDKTKQIEYEEGKHTLQHLLSWESEFLVMKRNGEWGWTDFLHFRQPKRAKKIPTKAKGKK